MFTGDEDLSISLTDGSKLTANYRAGQAAIGINDPVLGHYISKKALETILAQDNCVGARIYYGQTDDGDKRIVFVGVTANENDITEGFIGDRNYKSPPHSGSASSLNS